MAKTNDLLLYAGIGVAAYFGYVYAVKQLMIPDYIGLVGGYPRTGPELEAVKAQLLLNAGQGTGTGAGVGTGQGSGTGAGTGTGAGNGSGASTGNGAGSGSSTGSGASNGTSTGTATGGNTSVKEAVWNAAKNEANAMNGKLHFWSWNYYLPEGVNRINPFTLNDAVWAGTSLGRKPVNEAEVQNTLLTLDQWWGMVSPQLGLSGMGRTFRGVNSWGQQPSQWLGSTGGYRIQ